MLRMADIPMSEKDAQVSFALSKMTVQDEMSHRFEYFKLHFVEFMEFVCRVADLTYTTDCHHESDEEEESIAPKVQRLLQFMLPTVGSKLDLGELEIL